MVRFQVNCVTHSSNIRGRFAPSPTGALHLGSLVSALGSYFMAKMHQGCWLIRIEDLDPPREISGMAKQQIQTLADFGLISDEPIIWQSERSAYYQAVIQQLLTDKKAFLCHCSRSQLATQAGIHRACINTPTNTVAAVRLRVPDMRCLKFHDGLFGLQQEMLAKKTGDFVLKRTDGLYAYQLAVVVDDAAQQINQIVRGADLLDSTARQIFLQQQLNYPQPDYWHLPLVRDANGNKLSKSQWAADLNNEDRFNALCAAYAHLGQDIRVLSRQWSIAKNIQQALKNFQLTLLQQLIIHAPHENPDAHSHA